MEVVRNTSIEPVGMDQVACTAEAYPSSRSTSVVLQLAHFRARCDYFYRNTYAHDVLPDALNLEMNFPTSSIE